MTSQFAVTLDPGSYCIPSSACAEKLCSEDPGLTTKDYIIPCMPAGSSYGVEGNYYYGIINKYL
jgi:hypothetical protein